MTLASEQCRDSCLEAVCQSILGPRQVILETKMAEVKMRKGVDKATFLSICMMRIASEGDDAAIGPIILLSRQT